MFHYFNAYQLDGYTRAQIDLINEVASEYGDDPLLCDITADYAEELLALA